MIERKKILKYHYWSVTSVAPILGTAMMYLEWNSGERAVLDFGKLTQVSKQFQPLSQPAEFENVSIIGYGGGIEWRCGAGLGSDQLRHMADEQNAVFRARLGAD